MTYQPRTIKLDNQQRKELAIAAIQNAPLDQNLEVVIRTEVKVRKPTQNALMWSGTLEDISAQVWENGRQYSAEGWHEVFKILYMPDENTEPYIHELVINPETYRKWEDLPNGERRCLASTTDLTTYGFGLYLDQIHAFGASKGVKFTEVRR